MAVKKILIVDDDPGTVTVLSLRFKAEGYEICVARDGEEAVIKAKEKRPDLIILDVLLPKMTGYEVMWKIREDKELEHIPLLVISVKESMREFFLNLSRVEFLAKPYDLAEFSEKVHQLVGSAGGPDEISFL